MNEPTPSDLASESGLLSVLLSFPEQFIKVADLLLMEDFYSSANQQIWNALTMLYQAGKGIDLSSVQSQIRANEIDPEPAIRTVMEHWDQPALGGNLLHFIEAIKNKSILRQIIKLSDMQKYSASVEGADAIEVVGDIEKNMLNILDRTKEVKPVDSDGINNEIDKDIAYVKEHGWQGQSTGMAFLDARTGGFIPSQSWIIGAYTGVGKTFFILQLLLNVLRQGGKVVLFSTEMDRKLNMLRLISNISGIGPLRILRAKLLPNEEEQVKQAQEELRKYKNQLFIYDSVYTLSEMRLKAKKLKLTKGLDLMAVDFIQNLRGAESIYDRMSAAAVGLQQLAQELQITMLIGSQVSQTAAGWQSKQAIEFKGAGEIAAIADVALWISRDDKEKNGRIVSLRKVRHGENATFLVKLEFPAGRIITLAKDENFEDKKKDDDDTVTGQLETIAK